MSGQHLLRDVRSPVAAAASHLVGDAAVLGHGVAPQYVHDLGGTRSYTSTLQNLLKFPCLINLSRKKNPAKSLSAPSIIADKHHLNFGTCLERYKRERYIVNIVRVTFEKHIQRNIFSHTRLSDILVSTLGRLSWPFPPTLARSRSRTWPALYRIGQIQPVSASSSAPPPQTSWAAGCGVSGAGSGA